MDALIKKRSIIVETKHIEDGAIRCDEGEHVTICMVLSQRHSNISIKVTSCSYCTIWMSKEAEYMNEHGVIITTLYSTIKYEIIVYVV